MGKTLLDKLWEAHVVVGEEGDKQLLYIDLHLLHEVTSPQAFEGLYLKGRNVRCSDRCFATIDHNVPTINPTVIEDEIAALQIDTLRKNCVQHHISLADIGNENQGIVHVVGPEQGLTTPGKTIVCGDSHTSTHGAFGALAFGIGTSEVEHVLATQTLWQKKPKSMRVVTVGMPPKGVCAKDVILKFLKDYGVNVGTGHMIEFTGDYITSLSMEERMTICNMAIEAGAKGGLIAPDEKTVEYVKNTGKIQVSKEIEEQWSSLYTDSNATFDKEIVMDLKNMAPVVTWGTNPSMGISIDELLPNIQNANDKKAYEYMGLKQGQQIAEIPIGYVFIGSCTNGRLSDLVTAANVVKGKHVKEDVTAIVVPGSMTVKKAAEGLGLDKVFKEAGFEWREPGCSMCLGMNPDLVPAGVHCASTSNRNFEGRQGKGARTHLVSPVMAALAALHGHFTDAREEDVHEALYNL